MSEAHIDVAYIARLAKLQLSEEETQRFTKDLEEVLQRVTELEAWDVSQVAPMAHPLPDMDALRADVPAPSLSNADVMANAPQSEEGQIRVPKVVESAH